MRRFSIGDLAVTQGTRLPLLTDRLVVRIIQIAGAVPQRDVRFGYMIERVDGEPFPYMIRHPERVIDWSQNRKLLCDERYLQPLKLKPQFDATVLRIEQSVLTS